MRNTIAMQLCAQKDTPTMQAHVDQLRYNSNKPDIGGGPHTLHCMNCTAEFQENQLIAGPKRRRGPNGSDQLPPVYHPTQNPDGYKLLYWHVSCGHPFGYTNTPITAAHDTTVKPGQSNGWQHTDTATNTDTSASDLVDAIIAKVAGAIAPITQTLDAHIADNRNDFHTVTNALDTLTYTLNTLKTELATIKEIAQQNKPVVIQTTHNTISQKPTQIKLGYTHKKYRLILRTLQSKAPTQRNVWLYGPVGGGKTTLARQLATALFADCECPQCTIQRTNSPHTFDPADNHFFFTGAISTEYKLSGFVDANGVFRQTQFYTAWKYGGVFLFDECDRSLPAAVMPFNSALANGYCDFPEGSVNRHPNTYILVGANTTGEGNDPQYNTAQKMDLAFRSRFPDKIALPYDEDLEHAIAPNQEFTDMIQAMRALTVTHKLSGVVFDPRQSMAGCQAIASNLLTRREIYETMFEYLETQGDTNIMRIILAPARAWRDATPTPYRVN